MGSQPAKSGSFCLKELIFFFSVQESGLVEMLLTALSLLNSNFCIDKDRKK